MKRFSSPFRPGRSRCGFSLVETVLSVGIMSFGFLSLAPLLVVGLNGARLARETRATAQIAATLVEEGKQGKLAAGTAYFDSALHACASAQAAYTAQSTLVPFDLGGEAGGNSLTRLTMRIAPRGPSSAARTYVDVFPALPVP